MSPANRRRSLQTLFLLSGAPGLAAQLCWTRVFTAGIGHEAAAMLAVISVFLLGLSTGAWTLDRVVSRSPRPIRWYAGLELFSGAWIAITTPLLPLLNRLALRLIDLDPPGWRQALVALVVPALVVVPAAAAMGATLPAIDRAVAPLVADRRALAGLYALNTAGAVLGVLGAMWLLVPAFGFRITLWAAAAIQLAIGFTALCMDSEVSGRMKTSVPPQAAISPSGWTNTDTPFALMDRLSARRLAATAFLTGVLGIGVEVLGVRALAQVTENTVYTFAGALAVFLVGTSAGAGLARLSTRSGQRKAQLATWLIALSVICLSELWVLALSPSLFDGLRRQLGGTVAGAMGTELILAIAVFFAPTLLMGAIFSEVAQLARQPDGGVGRVVAWNMLGGALGPAIFAVLLLPRIGLKWSLVVLAVSYLALVPGVSGWRGALLLLPFALVPLLPADLRILPLPRGASVADYREGAMATVAVTRTADGHRALRVNNHFQQGGTATAGASRRHAHLPLLLHPRPQRALFLGVGTGITLSAAAAHPGLRADGVELLPEVVAMLPHFQPENDPVGRDARLGVFTADARRFVRCATQPYDVIVADLFHPSEDGAGFLYTREHFTALRDLCAPGGLVCQWLPLHQLDLAQFRNIARTFLDVFPESTLWLLRYNVDTPVAGLIGGREPLRCDADATARRMLDPELAASLRPLALTEPVRLFGCLLAGNSSLVRWAADGQVATDDQPRVLFGAPAFAYDPRGTPHGRLIEILGQLQPRFEDVVGPLAGTDRRGLIERLEQFATARDFHLRGLAKDAEGRRREALEDYVASAAASADYTGGYAQAVLTASAHSTEDPTLARKVLERLAAARPEQRLARELLERLGKTSDTPQRPPPVP